MLILTYAAEPSDEPRFDDYPSLEAYRLAWYTWRAIQRDERLNPEEHTIKWDVTEQAIKNRLYG